MISRIFAQCIKWSEGSESEARWGEKAETRELVGLVRCGGSGGCLVCLASPGWPPSQPPFWQPPKDHWHNMFFLEFCMNCLIDTIIFFQILTGRLEKNPEVSFCGFSFTISPKLHQQKLLWKLSQSCSNFVQLFQSFTLVINMKNFSVSRIRKFWDKLNKWRFI